jgi:hypothetical protein
LGRVLEVDKAVLKVFVSHGAHSGGDRADAAPTA